MSRREIPDTFRNSLVKHKTTGEIKRVVRDDGENGLHLSPPDNPPLMRPITRDEFREEWELFQTVEEQLAEERSRPEKEEPFRNGDETVVTGVDLSSQVTLPSIDSRNGVIMTDGTQLHGALATDPFAGRTTPTARPSAEEVADFIAQNPKDSTFSGQPVGGNEEPAETFEADRADDDATATPPENTEEKVRKQTGTKKSTKDE